MAILWDQPTPWLDPNGDPYSGAKAYFFDANTTTPLVTYTEYTLSIPHDHPVVADAAGKFPAVFLPEQILYRVRITTADGVTLDDIDGISTPTTAPPEVPEGDTPIAERHQTGDIKWSYRSAAQAGWVRLNGRTIGSGASAATERANADCQALFIHLWNEDPTLVVAGGRGGTANGDWAAGKTISLPDPKGRAFIVPDSFGAAPANVVTDAQLGAESDQLGAKGGSAARSIARNNLPASSLTFSASTDTVGNHGHQFSVSHAVGNDSGYGGGLVTDATYPSITNPAFSGTASPATFQQIGGGGSHSHTVSGSTEDMGSGTPMVMLPPIIVIPVFMKL